MNCGNNIKKYRIESNLSQEQLAEKMEVSRQAISRWELNETEPDIAKIMKLAEIFNITTDALLGSKVSQDVTNSIETKGEIKHWLERKGYLIIGIIMTIIGCVPVVLELCLLINMLYIKLFVPGKLVQFAPTIQMIISGIFFLPFVAILCFGIHFIKKYIRIRKGAFK